MLIWFSQIEGLNQFSYEESRGGEAICDNQDSQIKTCQDPGSLFLENVVFYMTYRKFVLNIFYWIIKKDQKQVLATYYM